MRSSKSILNMIRNTSMIVGLSAIALLGSTAHAEGSVQQRAEMEMSQGLDYAAAWQVASRAAAPVSSPRFSADAKSYVASWEATGDRTLSFSAEQIATARRAQEQMNEGRDYVAAIQASDKVEPVTIEAAQQGTTLAGRGRARSVR